MSEPMTPERLAEIEQRRASGRIINTVERDLIAEVRRLQAAVERVRELHGPHPYASDALRAVNPDVPASVCWECVSESGGAVAWPCPTIAALTAALKEADDD